MKRLLTLLVLFSVPLSFAQLSYRGEVEVAGDLLWTVEAAYAPLFANGAAHPQVLGQFSLPRGDAGSLDLNVGLARVDSVSSEASGRLQASGSLLYTHGESEYQVTMGVVLNYTEGATVYGLRFGVTTFF